LLVAWDGALRVNLCTSVSELLRWCRYMDHQTYKFTIEQMLLDHDDVDDLGIFECKEAEAARATSDTVAHDSAFCDLAELGEVILE
jgi:hypothetical protein